MGSECVVCEFTLVSLGLVDSYPTADRFHKHVLMQIKA